MALSNNEDRAAFRYLRAQTVPTRLGNVGSPSARWRTVVNRLNERGYPATTWLDHPSDLLFRKKPSGVSNGNRKQSEGIPL